MTKMRPLMALLVGALVFLAGCQLLAKPEPSTKKPATKPAPRSGKKSKAPKNAGMKVFSDPNGLFTIDYPKTWFANGASNMAVEISPLRSNTTLRNERDTSVPSVELRVGAVEKNRENKKMLAETVKAMLAAKPAASKGPLNEIDIAAGKGAWQSVELATARGDIVKIFIAIGGGGKQRMIMMGFSPTKDWEKNLQIFKKMAESFAFTPKA